MFATLQDKARFVRSRFWSEEVIVIGLSTCLPDTIVARSAHMLL
jgi:hypothetical protein